MQKVNREILIGKAKELLSAGTVDRVLGWKKGDFDYDDDRIVEYMIDKIGVADERNI